MKARDKYEVVREYLEEAASAYWSRLPVMHALEEVRAFMDCLDRGVSCNADSGLTDADGEKVRCEDHALHYGAHRCGDVWWANPFELPQHEHHAAPPGGWEGDAFAHRFRTDCPCSPSVVDDGAGTLTVQHRPIAGPA